MADVPVESDKKDQSSSDTGNQLQQKNAVVESLILKKDVRGDNHELDLIRTYVTLNLQESISEKFVTGTLVFQDTGRVFDETPFVGTETVTVKIKSLKSGLVLEKLFDVYNFEVIQPEEKNSSAQIVCLWIRDPNVKILINEYSTSFKDKLITDFVKDFCDSNFDITSFVKEDTDAKTTMAFPFQKFHYILKQLRDYAKNEDGNGYYVFFSNLFLTYYGSLAHLFKSSDTGEPLWTYQEDFPDKTPLHPLLFHDYNYDNNFDIEKFVLDRGAGSTQWTFNPASKSVVSTPQVYSKIFKKETLVPETFSKFPSTIDNEKAFNFYDSDAESIRQQNAIFEQSLGHGTHVTLRTVGLFEVSCGVTVKINFKDFTTGKTPKSEFKSGTYLISSVLHQFRKEDYRQTIVAVRNFTIVKDNSDQVSS